ncbi:MAG: RNA 2',3'-cyclic phosphodiesterase [Deltaproteobacteria bacterium]|nr:RNA 2',3'-cyclic phosphodiesterase [Deltaproteobacteria bacterium]
MIRLFVSVELGEDVRNRLWQMCCDVPGARWTEPDQMHLTLRFIGEVEGHVFEDIRGALNRVHADAFEISLRGVGHFPPRGQPRVLWAGIERSEELLQLQRRVESTLVQLGLPPERRRFSPHVTLARLNGTPARAVGSYIAQHGLFRAGPIPVESFFLYSSQLGAKHAVHREEAEYPLPLPGA